MSLLLFRQSHGTLGGLFLLDADPDWALQSPRDRGEWLGPELQTDEGGGHWLAFHPGAGCWTALLHRDDAPYNTCLPPGEALLEDHLTSTPDTCLDAVYRDAQNRFGNPFDLLFGDPSGNQLTVLEQAFQSRLRELEPGVHLRFYGDARGEVEQRLAEQCESKFPTSDQLRALAENRWPDADTTVSRDEGRRPTRAAVVFQWNEEGLQLLYADGYPPRAQWHETAVESEAV